MSAVCAGFGLSVALLLQGCGGGGGGGGNEGNPAPAPVLPSSETSAGDPGLSSPSGSISSSRSALNFSVFRRSDGSYGKQAPADTLSVHIAFNGDGVLIGFAPGVPQPSWLKLPFASSTPITAPDKQVDVSIGVDAKGLSGGTYSTSLRFVTGTLGNSASMTYIDLPVRVTVLNAPVVYSGPMLEFDAKEGQVSGSQSLSLNFGALTSVKVSTSAGNANSIGANWMAVKLDEKDDRKVTVALKPETIAGMYEGYAVVKYTSQGTSDEKLIPVRLKVAAAGRPAVDYASPPLQYLNKPGSVIVRGRGFASSPLNGVTLGAQAASTFTVVNDTEIVARFDKLAAEGRWPVQLQFASGTVSAPGMIDVHAPLTLVGLDLDLGEGINRTTYDARRQNLLVKTEGHLLRLAQVDGAWKTVASVVMPRYAQFDYTPDYNQVLVTAPNGFELLDAETLQSIRMIDLPNATTGGVGGFASVSLEGIVNNGDVVLALRETSSATETFAVFKLSNQTLGKTTLMTPYRAALPSYFRDRLLFIQRLAQWGETGFVGFYSAELGGFVPLALPINTGTEGQYSLSANGNLVELTNDIFDINAGLKKTTIQFPDGIDSNGSVRISSDGAMVYFVSETDGYIKAYSLSGGALSAAGKYQFAPFHWYAGGTQTYLTPDNQAMILAGGMMGGASGAGLERRVVVMPLH